MIQRIQCVRGSSLYSQDSQFPQSKRKKKWHKKKRGASPTGAGWGAWGIYSSLRGRRSIMFDVIRPRARGRPKKHLTPEASTSLSPRTREWSFNETTLFTPRRNPSIAVPLYPSTSSSSNLARLIKNFYKKKATLATIDEGEKTCTFGYSSENMAGDENW